jgi:hypothetical protein
VGCFFSEIFTSTLGVAGDRNKYAPCTARRKPKTVFSFVFGEKIEAKSIFFKILTFQRKKREAIVKKKPFWSELAPLANYIWLTPAFPPLSEIEFFVFTLL